jgi:hypothetical protein
MDALLYRAHVRNVLGETLPTVSSGAELVALIKTIPVPDFEAGNGWESKPPFPGLSEAPEQMPTGWRMICACRLYDRDDKEIAVLFTTFVTGRRAGVFVSGPGTTIPEQYLPIASR